MNTRVNRCQTHAIHTTRGFVFTHPYTVFTKPVFTLTAPPLRGREWTATRDPSNTLRTFAELALTLLNAPGPDKRVDSVPFSVVLLFGASAHGAGRSAVGALAGSVSSVRMVTTTRPCNPTIGPTEGQKERLICRT